jgi:1,4-alpha-glucan branching enzyme
MSKGLFSLVLHAHLPFVRHPDYERFLEENWLYEAISETYLPLLRAFRKLESESVPFRITMSFSGSLASMLEDDLLAKRYIAYNERLIELSKKEIERTKNEPQFALLAEYYRKTFEANMSDFTELYKTKILSGFRYFAEKGNLELITSSATHCFLPLMQNYPDVIDFQIRVAVESHTRLFGKPPAGMWIPECGYYPGLEQHLKQAGIGYFFTDTHGILFAERVPKYGIYAPLFCNNMVAAFGRDPQSSWSVWSPESGYPADFVYREFYRDIGYDLPIDYIRPYIQAQDLRIDTGIKYYAITGDTKDKRPYNREDALSKVKEHAENFVYMRLKQIGNLSPLMDRSPVIISPFDAELFGHWWYEGPEWIYQVMKMLYAEQDKISMVTPSDYLAMYPSNQVATPSFSSWGNNGYGEVWLEKSNDWIYRHLHKSAERMSELVEKMKDAAGPATRALNQAARELLLAESSDWAFIMKTGTTVPYAVKRTKEHISNFNIIYKSLLRNTLDENWLASVEKKNNIFPDIDYRKFGEAKRETIKTG